MPSASVRGYGFVVCVQAIVFEECCSSSSSWVSASWGEAATSQEPATEAKYTFFLTPTACVDTELVGVVFVSTEKSFPKAEVESRAPSHRHA